MPFRNSIRRLRLRESMYFLATFLLGCTTTITSKPLMSANPGHPPRDIQFWYDLPNQPIASNDDAFHGLLLAMDGADSNNDYAARVQSLQQRGLLPKDFHEAGDQPLRRGTLAVCLVNWLHLKDSLSMKLFGAQPRYAIRELEYRQLYPLSSSQQVFSGLEFVGVISRIEKFVDGDPANYPATVLYPGATAVASAPDVTADDESSDESKPIFLSDYSIANFFSDSPTAPDTQPSTKPLQLPPGPLKINITGVRGSAEFRIPPAEDWTAAQVGQALPEGAQLRTSYGSAVQIQIVPDQTVTLDPLGVLTISRAALTSGKFTTKLSMPHGGTRMLIEGANREFDASVSSPNATLGIRGTQVSLVDQRPFPPEAVSLTGRAQFKNTRKQAVFVGKKGQGKTKIVGSETSAAQFSLGQAVVDPTNTWARTQSEQPLVASLLSRGAVFGFDRELGIPVVHGGIPPKINAPNSDLIPLLPGELTFVLRWNSNVNLNIAVLPPPTATNPNGEELFTAPGLVQTLDGGRIPFDHRGGKHGGIEVAYWPANTFSSGQYAVIGTNQSTIPSSARIDAFLNGKQIASDPDANLPETQTAFPNGESDAIQLYNIGTQAASATSIRAASSAHANHPFVGPLPVPNRKQR